jgi:Flp pilus assembly protein protease CpaA
MVKFLWVVVLVSSALGGLVLAVGALLLQSAPQQAAAAAIAVGLAVIPYCIARAAEGLR